MSTQVTDARQCSVEGRDSHEGDISARLGGFSVLDGGIAVGNFLRRIEV